MATTEQNTGLLNGNTNIENIANNAVTGAQAANDDAHKILTELFGSNWDNLFSSSSGGGGASTALFEIFGYMNAVTLIAVAVLLFYVITVGIIGTAHEGEALGKRYSTLWTPIRSVSAIAMLMPLPGAGGISLLQALLLLCISIGSNSANMIWTKVLTYLGSNNGSLVTTMPTSYSTATYDLAAQILEAEVAQEYISLIASGGGGAGITSESSTDLSSARGWFDMLTTTPFTGDNRNIYISFDSPIAELDSKFGKIAIQCDSSYAAMCEAEKEAITTMISSLIPIATQIATKAADKVDSSIMTSVVSTFNQAIYQTAQQAVSANNPDFQAQTQAFIQAAGQRGWIQAGSWYWTLSGMQERTQAAIERIPAFKERVAIKDIESAGFSDISDVMAILDQYKYVSNADIRAAAAAGHDGNIVTDFLRDTFGRAFLSLPNMLIEATTKGDPIANFKTFGSYAIDATVTIGAAVIAMDAASSLNPAAATGKAALGALVKEGAKEANSGTLKAMFGPISFLLIPIFMFFLYITYYLPSIPFVLWATGVVGWFVLIMETVAIAPLWAASHAIPEGEGFAGQHGKQGYMLFMGVLMRPALMICGFFMSMFMIKGVSWFVGQGLYIYFNSANASEVPGPLTAIAMTIVGLTIIIKLTHKCFDLIAWMPDNAMKWIGGAGGPNLGEGAAEQHTNNMFGAAMGNLKGATKTMSGGAAGGAGNPVVDSLNRIEKLLGGQGQDRNHGGVQDRALSDQLSIADSKDKNVKDS